MARDLTTVIRRELVRRAIRMAVASFLRENRQPIAPRRSASPWAAQVSSAQSQWRQHASPHLH